MLFNPADYDLIETASYSTVIKMNPCRSFFHGNGGVIFMEMMV